jgi:hypothetical protein
VQCSGKGIVRFDLALGSSSLSGPDARRNAEPTRTVGKGPRLSGSQSQYQSNREVSAYVCSTTGFGKPDTTGERLHVYRCCQATV